MNKKEWISQIDEWRIKYKVPKPIIKYEPTKLKLACKKCTKLKSKMSRHHKCNDYLFACLLPDVYAKRYLEFRDGDVDKLCESCHRRWHNYIRPFLAGLYEQLNSREDKSKPPTEAWCESWRRSILERYNQWLGIMPRQRKVKRR